MLVFAFDRDWTVDVNPHPNRDAVPLEWVRTLAHETEHAVYAIGNQRLTTEAEIPGVVDIVDSHPDDRAEWLGEQQPDGRYERFPTRRERLGLVADLHSDADGYVVVDDIDLSDVRGWDHYHAWEFVPAVREGRIDSSLPWCESRLADGGYPTVAGTMLFGVDDLREFLAEHEDAAAFQLRYSDDDERDRVVADIRLDETTVRRPAAAAAVECTALPPGAGTVRDRVDDIRMVSVVDPPDELFAVEGETPHEQAAALADLARVAPDRVSVPSLLDLLDSEDAAVRADALDALAELVDPRLDECLAALPRLRELAVEADHPADALGVLAAIAEAHPADVAPFSDELVAHLDADDDDVRRAAARCISAVADYDATDALDAVPSLVLVVEGRDAGVEHALYALNRIAAEVPAEVRPATPALTAVLSDPSLDATARLNATAALGRVASEYPDAGVQAVDALRGLLDAEDQRIRANAAGVLSDVATHHADALVPHVGALAPLLESDDDYASINATAALSRVAETAPETVAHLVDRFVALLEHDHSLVRLNACWALGHLRASDATDRLEELRTTDADEEVRTRAAWAIAEIERHTDGNP